MDKRLKYATDEFGQWCKSQKIQWLCSVIIPGVILIQKYSRCHFNTPSVLKHMCMYMHIYVHDHVHIRHSQPEFTTTNLHMDGPEPLLGAKAYNVS